MLKDCRRKTPSRIGWTIKKDVRNAIIGKGLDTLTVVHAGSASINWTITACGRRPASATATSVLSTFSASI
jgi:hypothetical protein